MQVQRLLSQCAHAHRKGFNALSVFSSRESSYSAGVGGYEIDPKKIGHDSDYENVMKVVQRFEKDPLKWPVEDQPFALVDRNFIGKVMHMVEFRPERGYAHFVPIGMMLLRHMFRKYQAKGIYTALEDTGIFNEEGIRAGSKKAFELISQNARSNTLAKLVEQGICSESAVKRFEAAGVKMSERQRELFNLTEDDIFAIAPGGVGPFQFIRPLFHNNQPYMGYGILCCAFYKKDVLFKAVSHLPILEKSTPEDKIDMPKEYGYDSPRLVFGYITLGNKVLDKKEFSPEVSLLDFQYLVM